MLFSINKTIDFLKTKSKKTIDFWEKIIRTDLRYLIKGYFWLGIDYFVGSFAGLTTSIAFANLVLPEAYGMYKYAMTIMSFLSLTTLYRLNDSLTISIARGFEGDILRILKTRIKWGLLGSVAGIILSGYYYLNNNQALSILVLIIAFFTPIIDTPYIYGNYLSGKKKFKTLTIINTASTLAYSIGIIIALFLSKSNVVVITFVYLSINFLIRLIALIFVFGKYKPNNETESNTISYGKKISYLSIMNTVASQIDNLFVFHYLGALELAAYVFIKKLPEHIKDSLSFLTPLSTPIFSVKNMDDLRIKKETIRKSFLLAGSMLAIILVYVALAPFIFKLIFPVYKDYVFLSQIYALSLPAAAFGVLLLNFMESARKIKKLTKLNIIFSILKTIIIFVAIKYFGLTGLVSSFLIIRIIYPLMITYFFWF